MPSVDIFTLTNFSRLSNRSLRVLGLLLCVGMTLPAINAKAQQTEDAISGHGLTIVPRLTLTETYSSNVNLSNINKQSEFTTEISPGVIITSGAGRLKGYFDYSLSQLLYERSSSKNTTQRSLSSLGSYEISDNFAFLDFSGNISQQSISAFGTQSIDNASLNLNRTEVSTYHISPYIRGKMVGIVDYEVRYNYDTTRNKSVAASDMDAKEGVIKLSGDSSFSRFRWTADLSSQNIDYDLGRKNTSDRLSLNLIYAINPQLEVVLIGGKESNNYTSLNRENHGSSGYGLNWRLSDATRFSGRIEHRYFGNTHNLSLEHRTPRTAWSYVDNKSISTPNAANQAGFGGLYDLLYSQFSTVEPDPIKRAQLVRSFLQVNGLDPSSAIAGAYSTSALTLQRGQTMTAALMGIRDTITISVNRSTAQSLGNVASISDDFSNTNSIRQNGINLSFSHRLTPDASLNLLISQQKSMGDSASLKNKLRAFGINLSTRLTEKAYGNFGVRHVISDDSSSYRETTLSGSINIQF